MPLELNLLFIECKELRLRKGASKRQVVFISAKRSFSKSDIAEMEFCSGWQPVFVMVAIDFALAIVNVLLEKVIIEGMNHLVLIFYRTVIGTVFLAPIAYFWERKSRPNLTAGILCYFFLSALMGATLTQYFFLLGIQHTSATFACAFINIVPVITFVMALPFGLETVDLKSKAGKAKVIGTVVSVGGAMVLTLYRGIPLTNNTSNSNSRAIAPTSANRHKKNGEQWTIGSLTLVAGSVLWSSWFLLQAKLSKRYPSQYSATAFMCFFSAIQSAALGLVINRDISVWVLKGKIEILTVVYTGIMGSGLSFVGMSWCVKKRGPLFTAAFSPLIQIIVAMFDFSILHEQLHFGSVFGSILVIVGLYILLWGKSHEAKACIAKSIQPNTDEEENQASTS